MSWTWSKHILQKKILNQTLLNYRINRSVYYISSIKNTSIFPQKLFSWHPLSDEDENSELYLMHSILHMKHLPTCTKDLRNWHRSIFYAWSIWAYHTCTSCIQFIWKLIQLFPGHWTWDLGFGILPLNMLVPKPHLQTLGIHFGAGLELAGKRNLCQHKNSTHHHHNTQPSPSQRLHRTSTWAPLKSPTKLTTFLRGIHVEKSP